MFISRVKAVLQASFEHCLLGELIKVYGLDVTLAWLSATQVRQTNAHTHTLADMLYLVYTYIYMYIKSIRQIRQENFNCWRTVLQLLAFFFLFSLRFSNAVNAISISQSNLPLQYPILNTNTSPYTLYIYTYTLCDCKHKYKYKYQYEWEDKHKAQVNQTKKMKRKGNQHA